MCIFAPDKWQSLPLSKDNTQNFNIKNAEVILLIIKLKRHEKAFDQTKL